MNDILPFHPSLQQGVLDLILKIQTLEFGLQITQEQQPDLMAIGSFYQVGKGNFWCALSDQSVVGTIALLDIGEGALALRKMFVANEHRGTGLAKRLLETAFNWAKAKECQTLFLGTTEKFLAAHRFYEKNGFISIPPEELPESFPIMKVDRKFYKKSLMP